MLYLKELKKTVFSVTFILLAVFIIIMAKSQEVLTASTDDVITEPQPGLDNYGTTVRKDPEVIMPAAFRKLYGEFVLNDYQTYPVGFVKYVTLSDSEQKRMAGILAEITGESEETLYNAYLLESGDAGAANTGGITMTVNGGPADSSPSADSGGNAGLSQDEDGGSPSADSEGNAGLSPDSDGGFVVSGNMESSGNDSSGISMIGGQNGPMSLPYNVKDGLSYEEFERLMSEAADLIGAGTDYDPQGLVSFSRVPMTYEEALESYELTRDKDHFTGAYARLFSDYMVAILCVLPVFPAVAMCLKDKRGGVSQLIYTRKASSFKVILTRYGALLTAVFVPTLIVSYIYNISAWKFYDGMALDYLAPLKYTLGWIMPSVMMAAAVGMFLTELTGTPIAVAVMGLWWLIDINIGIRTSGAYPLWQLAPRHNNLQKTEMYLERFGSLMANRIFFVAAALVVVLLTVIVFELKRKGKMGNHGGIKGLIRKTKSVAGSKVQS